VHSEYAWGENGKIAVTHSHFGSDSLVFEVSWFSFSLEETVSATRWVKTKRFRS
jgi:hypothetical protein